MYKLTYESDDEKLVGDLSVKSKYKSTETRRKRSMATKDPSVVPKYLSSSNEELKIRSDSTASAIFSAYPAAASQENHKVISKKETKKQQKEMKKKLVTLDNNETLEDKPRKKPNTDYFTAIIILFIFLFILTGLMFISYFTLKNNYYELKKDYLKSYNKQKQLEKRYTNELTKVNSILNQVLDNQKNAAARAESIENSELRQSDDFVNDELVLEKGETLEGKFENELVPFAIKLDILNATVYKNIELMKFIMSRQKELEEKLLLLLQDPN